MVKQLKQRYTYQSKQYTLPALRKFLDFQGERDVFGSLLVTTKIGITVKIVFVRNRNKKSEWRYILSTDCSLSDGEIVRIYGNRWDKYRYRHKDIEVFFKVHS